MEKKCALISLIISVLVGISLYVESFDYNEVIVYTLLTFIIIYLICSVSSNFIYDIFTTYIIFTISNSNSCIWF